MKQELLPENKYMLDIKEAAQYYGIGTKKMRRIAEDGKFIFSVTVGNRWMIHRGKFEDYIETNYFSGNFPGEDIPVKVF